MIISDLYPTLYTIDSGISDTDYDTEMTNGIMSLTPQDNNITNAYFLFYVEWDDIPSVFKGSIILLTTNSIEAHVTTEPQNVAGTYMAYYTTSVPSTNTQRSQYDYSYSDGAMHNNAYQTVKEYYNNFSIRKAGAVSSAENGVTVYCRNDSTNTWSYADFTMSATDYFEFLTGTGKTITISGWFGGGANPGIVVFNNISALSFGDGYYYTEQREIDSVSYTFLITIANYYFNNTRDKNYSTTHELTAYTNPTPMLRFYDNGNCHFRSSKSGTFGTYNLATSYHMYNNFIRFSPTSGTIVNNNYFGIGETIDTAPVTFGGLEFSLDRSVVVPAASNSGWVNGNCVILKSGQDLYIRRMYKPSEVLTHARLCTSYNKTDAFDFSSDKLVPKFDENDKFLDEWVSGTFEEIEDDLRPWQYETIKSNTLDPDDIPPYSPYPPPEPPEGEESGDSINWQERYYLGASNFITQYAMFDSQVQTFGQLLWTSWFSQGTITDMWKNFILVVNGGQQSDTGSYDVSSVMDFIVSLQIFPFALDAALAQDTTDIKIGMGAYPLQIGSTMRKILTTVIYLDFGSIYIPRPYGDFRDYDNMSISAVLPFCGTCELNPGDVVGRTLSCMYCVDLQTGNCHAMIKATDDSGHYYPIASLDGQLSANIALSATNESRLKAQRTMDAVNFAKMFTAPVLSIADTANSVSSGNKSYSGVANTLTDWAFMPDYITAEKISRGSVGCPMISGGNGLTAFMQPEQPYVQMRYGLYAEPDNYLSSEGMPYTESNYLSNFSGFTVCRNVNVDTIHCHADERSVIKAALESGVYL